MISSAPHFPDTTTFATTIGPPSGPLITRPRARGLLLAHLADPDLDAVDHLADAVGRSALAIDRHRLRLRRVIHRHHAHAPALAEHLRRRLAERRARREEARFLRLQHLRRR